MPAGLREQWRDELRIRFTLEGEIVDASALARYTATLPCGLNPWAVPRLVITSIDFVKRPDVIRALEPLVWDLIAFDEAHGLASRSDRANAAMILAARARNVVMLTATPHSGDEDAFARLTSLGDPNGEFPALIFRRTRADMGVVASRRSRLLRVRPTAAELAMHTALVDYARLVWQQSSDSTGAGGRLAATVLLRRAYSSASSLVLSLERRLQFLANASQPMDSAQLLLPWSTEDGDAAVDADVSAPGLRNRADEIAWLERLIALGRVATRDESKLRTLERILRRAKEPAIVFTHYRDTLDRIRGVLHAVPLTCLHGGLTARERLEALHLFTRGAARLLLATDAASEGLNLHATCRLVVNIEMPWTPLRLEQRIGRVDRMGQSRTVHAVHLVAAGTSEEAIVCRMTLRNLHIQAAMAGVSASREEEVAAAIVAGQLHHDRSQPNDEPLSGRPAELEQHAVREAARLMLVRAMRDRASPVRQPEPALTLLRRRDPGDGREVWAFRLVFDDTTGCPVWEAVVGLRSPWRCLNRAPAGIRRHLGAPSPVLLEGVVHAQREHRARLADALEKPLSLMTRREQAISDALRRHSARLSAALMQPGLFDRRGHRAAAAQTAVMRRALADCDERLEMLRRHGTFHDGPMSLAFVAAYI